MNRGEIRTYARRYLAELVPDDSFWSEPTLDDFINRSYEEVVSRAELLQCTSIGNVVYAAGEVHGEYSFPPDILRVLRVWYRSKPLNDRTMEEMNRRDAEWISKVCDPGAYPTDWFPAGQSFFLYPAPSETATGALTMRCIQTPAPLTADGHAPQTPTGYHEIIAVGAVLRALKSDRTSAENRVAVDRAIRDFEGGIAWAANQHLRKAPPRSRLQDIRDLYPTLWRA